ncbi:MAG: FixH family protein [Rhodospirillaceae bacterium]
MTKMQTTTKRPDGWWYPYIFVGGFAVVVTANLIMMYFATSTFTGLETKGAYERGLGYNQVIAQQEAQDKLGWTVAFSADGRLSDTPGAAERPTVLSLRMTDAQGQPLDGVQVEASVRRPTVAGYDFDLRLMPVGPGEYKATLDLPMAGQWDVQVYAKRGDDAYRLRERVVVH